MSPQEKAIELISKYNEYNVDFAKECSIILINSLIASHIEFLSLFKIEGKLQELSQKYVEYLTEVKIEIINHKN